MPWQPLATDRLVLRAFQRDDAYAFAAYRSDPAVARYQGWDAPYPLEQAQKLVAEMSAAEPYRPGEWYQVAIELAATGQLIGDAAFKPQAPAGRQAEVGLTLASAFQAQGFASEAMRSLLAWLFSSQELHRVYANCDVENLAARRGLERLGFRQEAHFIENLWFKGRWASEYWYALLRREWEGGVVL